MLFTIRQSAETSDTGSRLYKINSWLGWPLRYVSVGDDYGCVPFTPFTGFLLQANVLGELYYSLVASSSANNRVPVETQKWCQLTRQS
jgi:hypothetical protein